MNQNDSTPRRVVRWRAFVVGLPLVEAAVLLCGYYGQWYVGAWEALGLGLAVAGLASAVALLILARRGMRWYQVNLKMLAVLAIIVGIACLAVGTRFYRGWRDAAIVAKLDSTGGRVSVLHGELPKWMAFVGGKAPVTAIEIQQCTEDELKHVRGLSHLEALDCSGSTITDDGLASLATLPRLNRLVLQLSQVTGRGLAPFAGSGLSDLTIMNCPLDDEGAMHLSRMPALKALNIGYTSVGDEGAKQLSRLTALESLNIDHTRIGDEGAIHLSRLPRLKLFQASNTAVTLRAVRNMTGLEHLSLSETSVKDEDLSALTGLTKLKRLNLAQTGAAVRGVSALQALPLESLFLGDTNVSDKALDVLCRIQSLKQIDLVGTKVSADGILKLARLKNLTGLQIYGLVVDPEDQRRVKAAFPKLRILF